MTRPKVSATNHVVGRLPGKSLRLSFEAFDYVVKAVLARIRISGEAEIEPEPFESHTGSPSGRLRSNTGFLQSMAIFEACRQLVLAMFSEASRWYYLPKLLLATGATRGQQPSPYPWLRVAGRRDG